MELKIDLLLNVLDVHTIMLFGSILNKSNPRDIDLLIVSDDFEDMFIFKRKQQVQQLVESNTIDPVCVTVEEFLNMKVSGSGFSKQILLTGRVIYEKFN